jgi:predicted exporter
MIANRALFYGWSALVVALLAVAAGYLLRGIPLDTNILNLLPAAERDPLVIAAIERHNDSFSRNIAFLASAETESASQQAALKIGLLLKASELFKQVTDRADERQGTDLYRLYAPYRANLLSASDRKLLGDNKYDELGNRVLSAIASPAPEFNAGMLAQDPLLLFTRFLGGLKPQAGKLRLHNGMLTAYHDNQYHTLVSATIEGNAFAPAYQQKFLQFYGDLTATVQAEYPGVTLTSIGMIHNAAAGTIRAKGEISVISTVSMIGLLLLFAFGFRSLTPLIYALIPMTVGIIIAVVACLAVFGSIHIMTLVFGTSLIGVCMDYALHFFTERAYQKPTPSPQQCLEYILPGMTLGMLTSVIGYTAFYTTTFPGLQQMALFSSTGLIAAYCCVVFWFPRLPALRATGTDHISARCARQILAFWDYRNKSRIAITLLAITLLAVTGIMLADVDDDIRSLDNSPPQLHADRLKFQEATGINPAGQFFVVSGDTPDAVLEHEEALADILYTHIGKGDLQEFRATSNYIPSARRQHENYQAVRAGFMQGDLSTALAQIGYQPEIVAVYQRLYSNPEPSILDFEHWRAAGHAMDTQWLDMEAGKHASLVYLLGAKNIEPILAATAHLEGIRFVDQVGGISGVLMKYRQLTNKMILAAYALIFLLLIGRYGFSRAATVLIPPLLAAASAFALLGFTGQPLTLFNSLATLLVLGLGIDYTIFLAESGDSRQITMIGILYSTITTVLAFGLLAFSGTPALKSMGLTVFYGITLTLLLAPVAKSDKNSNHIKLMPG